jgi:hypothetical protein
MDDGREILQDKDARSRTPGRAAFLSPPSGSPPYYGFPLIPETETDGWVFGAITAYDDPEGADWGDAFVVAPDGSRAGIVWSVGEFEIREIMEPDSARWGVYEVPFPRRVRDLADLLKGLRAVLPDLKQIHARIAGS